MGKEVMDDITMTTVIIMNMLIIIIVMKKKIVNIRVLLKNEIIDLIFCLEQIIS